MAHTRASLAADLRRLGLVRGDIVMVHASVRSVGKVVGGPDEIHLGVEEAVSPGGTVMMLAGCPDGYDDVGRGHLSAAEEAEIFASLPAFDPHAMRAARDNGTLAEFFRSWPGTIPSNHVCARIAARGARAQWLVADHAWNYGFGRGTPFEKLVAAHGKVLVLGADHDTATILHHAEHIADFPDKIIARYRVPVSVDGKRMWRDCEEVNTSSAGCHANWPDRFFARIVDDFAARHAGTALGRQGTVGDSDTLLLDAAALVAHAIPIMARIAGGESYF